MSCLQVCCVKRVYLVYPYHTGGEVSHPLETNLAAGFVQHRRGTHSQSGGVGNMSSRAMDASLGVCSRPVAEKESSVVCPRGCFYVIAVVIRLVYELNYLQQSNV